MSISSLQNALIVPAEESPAQLGPAKRIKILKTMEIFHKLDRQNLYLSIDNTIVLKHGHSPD
jgi:hypothetical protein